MLKFLDRLASLKRHEVAYLYYAFGWVMFVAMIYNIITFNVPMALFFWIATAYSFNYGTYMHQDRDTYFGVLIVGVIISVVVYLYYTENPTTKTVIDLSPARDVSFSDDTNTVHYRIGMTEEVRSHEFDDVTYYKNKANFYRDFKEGQTEERDGECYLTQYDLKSTFMGKVVYDRNETRFECQ